MTFRVADLMLEPVLAAKKRPKRDKDKDKCNNNSRCGECTMNTGCGHCSQFTDCMACTNCTACTCTRCTLTGMSTCTADTDHEDCTCPPSRGEQDLAALQAALQSKIEERSAAA
jgi:hypothetical protein